MPTDISNPSIFPRGAPFNEDNYGPVTVPCKGMKIALDVRSFGQWEVFIRREGHLAELRDGRIVIDGKPASEYTVERDYIFAMGDNRDISLDSRFWGFVPKEDVVGAPIVVYWAWNPNIPWYHPVDKVASINLSRIGTLIR